MGMKFKFGVLILSTFIALYAIIGGLLPRYGVVASNDPYSQMTIFHEVLTRIVEDYVDEPDLEKVRLGALRGLAEGLDPHSAYLTPDQVQRYRSVDSQGLAESGMVVSKVAGYLYVVSVIEDSPAAAAGVQAGDVIEYMNSRASRDMSLYDSLEMATGEVGKKVRLQLFRDSKKVEFRLAEVKRPDPSSRILETGTGYLRVSSLAAGPSAKLEAELRSLLKRGVNKLVLDLRGSADGKLEQGVALADLLISKGVLAKVVGKEGGELGAFEAKSERTVFNGPLVALIDRSTASAAEIVAAAILAHKRGDVVGERTFGAGGRQELFRLRDGGGLLITTTKFAAPSGQPFMGKTSATSGVKPSIEVRRRDRAGLPMPEELQEDGLQPTDEEGTPRPVSSKEDDQLKKAIELLRQARTS